MTGVWGHGEARQGQISWDLTVLTKEIRLQRKPLQAFKPT